jgi:hypothetical protein
VKRLFKRCPTCNATTHLGCECTCPKPTLNEQHSTTSDDDTTTIIKPKAKRYRTPGTNIRTKKPTCDDDEEMLAELEALMAPHYQPPPPPTPPLTPTPPPATPTTTTLHHVSTDTIQKLLTPQIDTATINEVLQHISTTRPSVHTHLPDDAIGLWCAVLDHIARRAITATTNEEKQRWEIAFLASPMLLLQRHYTAREDISTILLAFLHDESLPQHHVISDPEKDRTYTNIDRARSLIERENTSKALRVLQDTATFAPAAGLVEKLQTKVLHMQEPTPFTLPDKSRSTLPVTVEDIRRNLRRLKNCISPGTGMLSNEHIKPLAFHQAPWAMSLLSNIIHSVFDGTLPPHIKAVMYEDPLKGINKPDKSVRPICIGHTITKLAVKMLIACISKNIAGPRQFGYGKRYGTQKAAILLQQELDKGKVIVKTDLANAFSSVIRALLAAFLFDNPNTKPLWRYFADRYSTDSVFNIFDEMNNFVAIIKANIGINQGDTASLLLFDIFVSDCPKSVDSATVYQIHDDIYAACDVQDVQKTLQQLEKYVDKKGLKMNASKTQILCRSPDDIPAHLRHLAKTAAAKVGGIYIQPTPAPLEDAEAEQYSKFKGIDKLPLQHQLGLFHHCLKPKWRYALDAGHPTIVTTIVRQVELFQQNLLAKLLAPSVAPLEHVNHEQLTEDPRRGGLGFFKYTDRRDHILGPKLIVPKPAPSQWFSSLNTASQKAITFTHPVVTLLPTSHWLRLDDHAISAYIATLLDAWPCRKIRCDFSPDPIDIPNTQKGSHDIQRHLLGCSSCSGGLKTFRHDVVNQAIASTLRRHGAIYVEEPKNWPLRAKTSNSGRDGPDGMVHLGTSIFWTDIAVASQDTNDTHSAMTRIYNDKLRTYASAAALNIEVLPVVFSHLGAFATQCRKFEEKVRELSTRAWREVNNIVCVRLAKSLGLFIKHCTAKSFKINQ